MIYIVSMISIIYVLFIWLIAILVIWRDNPLNEIHISYGDNWYLNDSNWICFQLKIYKMVIEIKM